MTRYKRGEFSLSKKKRSSRTVLHAAGYRASTYSNKSKCHRKKHNAFEFPVFLYKYSQFCVKMPGLIPRLCQLCTISFAEVLNRFILDLGSVLLSDWTISFLLKISWFPTYEKGSASWWSRAAITDPLGWVPESSVHLIHNHQATAWWNRWEWGWDAPKEVSI